MLFSAVGSIGERLDSKFITAYFFPAFIAVLSLVHQTYQSIFVDRWIIGP